MPRNCACRVQNEKSLPLLIVTSAQNQWWTITDIGLLTECHLMHKCIQVRMGWDICNDRKLSIWWYLKNWTNCVHSCICWLEKLSIVLEDQNEIDLRSYHDAELKLISNLQNNKRPTVKKCASKMQDYTVSAPKMCVMNQSFCTVQYFIVNEVLLDD